MILKYIFGPLDKKYCALFFLLSLSGILLGVWVFILCIMYPFLLKETRYLLYLISICFLVYFQNRLLYNMCNKTKIENLSSLADAIKKQNNDTKIQPIVTKLLAKGVLQPDIDALITGVKMDCAKSSKTQRRLGVGVASADNHKYDAITRYHPPRPKNINCIKPKNCPKCNEVPVCTSNGWTCNTMIVPQTKKNCIK